MLSALAAQAGQQQGQPIDLEWFKQLADTEEEGQAMHAEYASKMRRNGRGRNVIGGDFPG